MPQMNPNANPMDLAIAAYVDKDLKQCVSTTAMSACECSDPELRQTLAQISQDGIRRQAQLAQMLNQKGWYVPPRADQATFNTLMPQLQAATHGLSAIATGAHAPQPGVAGTAGVGIAQQANPGLGGGLAQNVNIPRI